MKRTSAGIIAVLLILVTVAVSAQQRRAGGGTQPALGTPQTFTGTVISFTAAPGSGMPALAVSDGTTQKSFVLGPYWYLADAKFAAAAGDRVTVISLACTACATGDAVISVTNLTNGTSVTLRDESGAPLFTNRNGGARSAGQGQAAGRHRRAVMSGGAYGNCGGLLPDMTRKASFDGTIVSFTGGPGIGEPELKLATASGEKVFVPAPYRVVIDAGYTFTAGAKVALTAAPLVNDGEEEWVIITLKDAASGLEIVFRDANGYPVLGAHGRP